MRGMMRYAKHFCTLAALALLPPAPAMAGAWVMQEGRWQVIHNTSYYHSDKRFDVFGNSVSQPAYTKYEYNPYIEYGLMDHTTVGANLFVQKVHQSGNDNYGISDAELFVRSRLYQAKPKWKRSEVVISVQPMVKLPGLFEDDRQPKIGSDDGDIGLSIFAGHSFNYFKQVTYSEAEFQYRHRLGDPADQLRFNYTLGQAINHEWHVLLQSFSTSSVDTVRGAAFTQTSADDSDVIKGQISGVYRYNDDISLQGGAFMDLYGRNAGAGTGVLFSVWQRF